MASGWFESEAQPACFADPPGPGERGEGVFRIITPIAE